jgi:asparagine synthase (glutamine-hydrolysing)
MCGINGIVTDFDKVNSRELLIMSEFLRHRGPDDSGEFLSDCGRVGLAHRRFSIIDLSKAASQLM